LHGGRRKSGRTGGPVADDPTMKRERGEDGEAGKQCKSPSRSCARHTGKCSGDRDFRSFCFGGCSLEAQDA
jgi:hypothetical protein